MTHIENNNDYRMVAIEQLRKRVAELEKELKECKEKSKKSFVG